MHFRELQRRNLHCTTVVVDAVIVVVWHCAKAINGSSKNHLQFCRKFACTRLIVFPSSTTLSLRSDTRNDSKSPMRIYFCIENFPAIDSTQVATTEVGKFPYRIIILITFELAFRVPSVMNIFRMEIQIAMRKPHFPFVSSINKFSPSQVGVGCEGTAEGAKVFPSLSLSVFRLFRHGDEDKFRCHFCAVVRIFY